MSKLTPKQNMFVHEYLVDLNAAGAAVRAGYSEKGSEVSGCRLLMNINVQNALKYELAERTKNINITAERVLAELAKLGFADRSDIKDSDKLKALELLGKYLALFTENINLKNDDILSITIEDVME
jgi:phage terminase small subunit